MKNLLSKACLLSAALLTTLGAEAPQMIKPKPSVTPVEATPESDLTELRIAYPKNQVIDPENPVNVQMRLELYPLGFDSDFARAKEIRNSSEGQAIRVIIDDQPYLLVNQALDDIMGSEEINLDQILMVKIPETLSSGEHIIRAYPVRSFGESLKNREAFATSTFYTGEKIVNASLDLLSPFLTYNEPQGHFDPRQPILLDFLVSNATLSSDGYKVRCTIDGSNERILTEWTPYYLYGLGSGSHTIKLELLDFENTVISPLFNDLEHTITIGS